MPSFLVPQNSDIFDRWVQDATLVQRIVRARAGSPWQGLVPDLDPHQAPASGMGITSFGLVARPAPDSRGEVLMPDAGFVEVPADGAGLPLTSSSGTTALRTNITMLAMFNRTDSTGAVVTEWDKTTLATVGGDGTTVGSRELWKRLPSTGAWTQIPWVGSAGSGPPDAHEPEATREFLSDWAEFPAGAPGRTAYNGAIIEPVFVWCNLHDRAMVWPILEGAGSRETSDFETLTDRFSADFRARTVEHFGGRLYFGNTIEAGTQHRQRIRRTALFTADPLETTAGAGAFDIRDFSRDLLRLEKLGDLLVAYFEDGTAFIRLSNIATAPDAVQLLREQRGLISTFAVTSVGNQEHFGIFDDGWFFLDPSGRWTEVGMLNIDGVQVSKWKETFYNLLDYNQRHRLVVGYDGRFIRIAFPTVDDVDNTLDNQEVWIFDPRGNRVFRDRYPVSVWANIDSDIQAATIWSSMVGTWAEQIGSWDALAAKFGIKNFNHGTIEGHVFIHNYGIVTKFDIATQTNINPSWAIHGILGSGGDPTTLKTGIKLWMECISTGGGTVVMTFHGDSADGSEGGAVQIGSNSNIGDIDTAFRTFNFTAANIRYSITGTTLPIQIRSIMADIEMGGTEESFA